MRIEFSCSRKSPSVFVIVSKAAVDVAAAATSVITNVSPAFGLVGYLALAHAYARGIFAIFSNISNWKIFDLTFWQ